MIRIKILLVFVLFLLGTEIVSAQNFVTRWDLRKPGLAGNNSISFTATVTGAPANYTWNTVPATTVRRGTITVGTDRLVSIPNLPANATIELVIEPTNLKRFAMNNGTDQARLVDVKQWGTANWNSMLNAFYGATNLTVSATDVPNLASVSNMQSMFENCVSLTTIPNVGLWNTSTITNMQHVFADAKVFNQSLTNWNTDNVINMAGMFAGAIAFNQPLGNWNTAKVTNMQGMFKFAAAFNGDVGAWNTANVTDMVNMFRGATVFNKPLTNWTTERVTDMSYMFFGTKAFNQSLSHFTTSLVNNMQSMFAGATAFNQSLNNWNTGAVTNMANMFSGATVFNQPLANWNTTKVTNMGYMFYDARTFNGDIGAWNTVNVTNMANMFTAALVFNKPLTNWKTERVTDMSYMFFETKAFNQPLTNWSTYKVTDMREMFSGASSFDQDLSAWNFNSGVNLTNFLNNSALSCKNYSKMLVTWSNRNITGRTLGANGRTYGTNAAFARTLLTYSIANGGRGWIITDGGSSGSNCDVSTNAFVTKWDLRKTGSAGNNSISFTATVTGTGAKYTWQTTDGRQSGAGTISARTDGTVTITGLPANATIELVLEPTNLKRFAMDNRANIHRLMEIKQWGTANWTSMLHAFSGASNLIVSATDVPNLANVSNMQGMFQDCASLTTIPNVGLWDTSTITDMQYMFDDAEAFNQSLANWNTSKVTNMRFMFKNAVAFNGAVGAWNTANVTNMLGLFSGATAFNQPLDNWNTSKVTNMNSMFQYAAAFNGAVGTWNTASVTDMGNMFSGATAFNQPLDNWNTSEVTNMSYMFQDAVAFNGAIGAWNTAKVTDMGRMFFAAKVFNKPLTNWNTGSIIRMDYMFAYASAFNGNISNWNTGNVTDMQYMFSGATAFNQNLSRWCVGKISSQPSGFKNSGSWNVPGWGKCPDGVLAQIGKEADNPNAIKSVITVSDLKMIAGITGIVDGYEKSYQDYIDENPDEFSNPATVAEVQEMVSSFLFISTWKTTVANGTIVIPGTVGEGGATVNWGDGTTQNLAKGASLTHAYTAITPNITISVVGIVEGFGFYNSSTSTASPYRSNILTIEQWGRVKLRTDGSVFRDCSSLKSVPNKFKKGMPVNWDEITNMNNMFNGATAFNQNIGNWDTGNVTGMSFMFQNATAFNQNLNWNTAAVTTMSDMFNGATKFNGNISSWNTGKVTNMRSMFRGATAFNQNIGNWDTGKVTNMPGVFFNARAFNQNIGNWNTGKVISMSFMFQDATAFNQNIGNWDTGNVTNMSYMFLNATKFNGNIGSWNTGNVTDMTGMFNGAIAFNQNLSIWCVGKIRSQPLNFKTIGTWSVPVWGKCTSVLAQIGNEADNPNTIKSVITVGDLKMIAGVTGIVDGHETSYQDYIDENPDEFSNPATVAEVQGMVSYFNTFKSTWKTTVANGTIVIPGTVGEGGATVNWGDGTIQNLAKGASLTHAYAIANPNVTISVVGIVEGFGFYNSSTSTASPYRSNILTIEQWGSVKLRTDGSVFRDCSNLKSVPNKFKKGMPVNWDEITNMNNMFNGATAFNGNIGSWNTGNVTNMSRMFEGATVFNKPLADWTTEKVTDMSYMFADSKAFNQPLGNWKTGAVTHMQSMFFGTNSFDQSLGHFNTSKVTDMSYMFANAQAFNQPLGTWITAAVTNMRSMFHNASAFNGAVGTWVTDKVTNMQSLFAGATVFNQPLGNWKTVAVTNMQSMFLGANAFDQSLSHFNTSKVTDMSYMFKDATVFNQPLGTWTTAAVTNMEYMFANASAFNGAVGTWSTANVTNMQGLFSGAIAFKQPLTNWTTPKVTNMRSMFQNASSFNGAVGTWVTAKVTNMQGLFAGATAFNQPLGNWSTGAVTDMGYMFAGATAFNQPLGNWSTGAVTNMGNMFAGATAFNQLLTNWNTAKVTDMSYMFANASAFNGAVGTWGTAKVTNMQGMFSGATAFNQNLGALALNAGVDLTNFLDDTGLSCKNYADMLIAWASKNVTGRTLGAANRTYGTSATAARATLISKGWTITDEGASGSDCNFKGDLFVTKWAPGKNGTGDRLSFFTKVTGTGANYTWKTLDKQKSGSGTIQLGELATITDLPLNAAIELFIEPTNLKWFAIANGGDKERLMEVEQWGTASWEKMEYAFSGASNLTVTATDIPNLAKVTSMDRMFENCSKLEGPDNIGLWNTAKVTNMGSMFQNAKAFNGDVGTWNTANVTNMQGMFSGATAFNQNLSDWALNAGVNLTNFLNNTALSCTNYSNTLKGWANESAKNITLGAEGVAYGISAKDDHTMLVSKGWKITDAGATTADCGQKYPANLFVTKWDLGKTGTTGNSIISFAVETNGGLARYTWTASNGQKGSGTINGTNGWTAITGLPASSIIELAIEPAYLKRFAINNGINKLRLVDVVQWGTAKWSSMESAFYGAANLKVSATDSPNLTEVGTMGNMFRGCASVTTIPNINLWNTSNVSDMEGLFRDTKVFNQPLTHWNTAKVTTMRNMFNHAEAFDQDLSMWQWNKSVDLDGFLSYSDLNCNNLTIMLNAWDRGDLSGVILGAGNLLFGPSATDAHNSLVNERTWRIDGIREASFNCNDAFITYWDLSKEGLGNNSISFYAFTDADFARYYWTSSDGQSGGGAFNGRFGTRVMITGLPQNQQIKLFIESYHLKRFVLDDFSDKKRLMEVRQWGSSNWISMENAFSGASNLTIDAQDAPYLRDLRSMKGMFSECTILDGPDNIGLWNTTSVTDMSDMFADATAFNQPLTNWNTANVTNMRQMFYGAAHFDQPLNHFKTDKVIDMSYMFAGATAFNQPLTTWNTANVTNMEAMFSGATAFNRDLSAWTLNADVNLTNFLNNSGLNCNNYSNMLNAWAGRNVLDRTLGAVSRTYGNRANEAHVKLTTSVANGGKGWKISDGGLKDLDCQESFITYWDLSKEGTIGNSSIFFNATIIGTVNYVWTASNGKRGGGIFNATTDGRVWIIDLPTNSKIELSIESTNLKQFKVEKLDSKRLIEVRHWGASKWISMENAFYGASNLTISATDVPNLGMVSTMQGIFRDCSKLDGPINIGDWNTANVTNMSDIFAGATAFNQPLTMWNTANVTDMREMFFGAVNFNQPVNHFKTDKVIDMSYMFARGLTTFNQSLTMWNTANVTNMSYMFAGTKAFNQPLSHFKTDKVKNMRDMFAEATAFNQPLTTWNTANVIDMSAMFEGAANFDQPLNHFKTDKIVDMSYMFAGATAFNQTLTTWNTANVTNMEAMFSGAAKFNQDLSAWTFNAGVKLNKFLDNSGLNCYNYSNMLIKWWNGNVTNRALGAANIKYGTNAAIARANLVNTANGGKKWTITGDAAIGSDCSKDQSGGGIIILPKGTNSSDPAKVVIGNSFTAVAEDDKLSRPATVSLYPNPVSGNINLLFSNYEGTSAKVVITNILGQSVYQETLKVNAGQNDYRLNLVRSLAAGQYVLRVEGKDLTQVIKFIAK